MIMIKSNFSCRTLIKRIAVVYILSFPIEIVHVKSATLIFTKVDSLIFALAIARHLNKYTHECFLYKEKWV